MSNTDIQTEFSQETENRYALATRDLQEVLGGNELKRIMETRVPRAYWGTAPTNSPHICYILQAIKIKDLVDANIDVTVLIADLKFTIKIFPMSSFSILISLINSNI